MNNESSVRMGNRNFLNSKKGLWITLLVAAQALVLTVMLLSQYAIGWYGKEIQIKTAPVDPRDIFYGDYVILNYEISTLPLQLLQEKTELERGDAVYVELQPSSTDPNVYEAIGMHLKNPDVSGDRVAIKAKVRYTYEDTVQLQYGLERYYVPEGTGRQWEEVRDQLHIRISVAPWGNAKVEGFVTE